MSLGNKRLLPFILNTIATLTYHMTYYISGVLKVFQGEPLLIKDKYSFDHPPISCQEDWDNFLEKIWEEVKRFANMIEQLPDSQLGEDLDDKKYGSYYRNLHGIIEHSHYHLGQIVLIKKIIDQKKKNKK